MIFQKVKKTESEQFAAMYNCMPEFVQKGTFVSSYVALCPDMNC